MDFIELMRKHASNHIYSPIAHQTRMGLRKISIFNIILFLCLLILLFYYVKYDCLTLNETNFVGIKKFLTGNGNEKSSKGLNKGCRLPKVDPWNAEVLQFFDPKSDISASESCKVKYDERSKLINGTLVMLSQDGEECKYRCSIPVSDRKVNFTEWTKISGIGEDHTDCEVAEVKCEIAGNISYHFSHTQIVEKPSKGIKFDAKSRDVYVLVLDSISSNQFMRTLSGSKKYLEEEFGSIHFPYLNRVAEGSKQNAYAFLLDQRPLDMPETPWSPFKGGGRDAELCNLRITRDNFSYVGWDFEDRGYRTMIDLDSRYGLFDYGSCYGFDHMPADHYMNGFYNLFYHYPWEDLFANVYEKVCKEPHHYLFENMRQFSDAYKGQPKFSITWFVSLAHDSLNGVFHADKHFKLFFMSMREKFNDSYVIVMGDHGLRFGGILGTNTGKIDSSNPTFMISLPQDMRKNEDLVNQLKQNTKHLLSQHDVYATLAEIAQNNHKWTASTPFSTTKFEPTDRELKGSSILHPLPTPRDCSTLYIPFNHCICQHKEVAVQNQSLAIEAGQKVVEIMNNNITNSNYSSNCSVLTLGKELLLELSEFDPDEEGEKVYLIKFAVVPSGGKYQAYFGVRTKLVIFEAS
uniref:Sulfatase domain-containing protein n=1 Tax=Bursaphelenchus xylophilus TaxID=6326 RepID=A0A1I7SED7_BURXY